MVGVETGSGAQIRLIGARAFKGVSKRTETNIGPANRPTKIEKHKLLSSRY